MEKLLTYALKGDRLTHVSEVVNGYKCGCFCPECKEELSAVANIEGLDYEQRPHFAHQKNSTCTGAYESALHLLAKEVFAEIKQIFVPDFHHDYNAKNEKSIFGNRGKIVSFDSVVIEKDKRQDDGKFRPDAIGKKNGKSLIIEFAVTHYCDEEKLQKIRRSNTPAIEVIVDPRTAILDPAYLKDLLLNNGPDRHFVFNPEFDEKYKKEEQEKLNRKKIKEEEHLKNESLRIKNLIQCEKYNILLVEDGQVSQCPKNQDFFNYFKNTAFYGHPEIIKIVNSSVWNGEFYGRANTFKYVYIDGIQVITSSMVATYEECREMELLFKGLMEYKRRSERLVKNCTYCQFRKGKNTINGKDYITCSYLFNNKPVIDVKI